MVGIENEQAPTISAGDLIIASYNDELLPMSNMYVVSSTKLTFGFQRSCLGCQ